MTARRTARTSANPSTITLDQLHDAAIESACDLDREYASRHPDARQYMRPALEHEACPSFGWCAPMAGQLILVTFVAPGVRARSLL